MHVLNVIHYFSESGPLVDSNISAEKVEDAVMALPLSTAAGVDAAQSQGYTNHYNNQ